MALAEIVQRIERPEVVEGSPDEIAERLKTVKGGKRLTLIIPGEKIAPKTDTTNQNVKVSSSIRDIFTPSQEGFDSTGLSDDELTELVETEVKLYRAEQRSKASRDS